MVVCGEGRRVSNSGCRGMDYVGPKKSLGRNEMDTVIKRSDGYHCIGPELKRRREELGLLLKDFCKLIQAGIGEEYIVVNGSIRHLSKQTIFRIERMATVELEPVVALVIKKTLAQ